MPRGRPRNSDRQLSIDLGLPTYDGSRHPACGTTERFISGGCVACEVERRAGVISRRLSRRAAREETAREPKPDGRGRWQRPTIAEACRVAAEAGQTSYEDPAAHKRCGTFRRYVKGGTCVECARAKGIAKYHADRAATQDAREATKMEKATATPERAVFEGPRPTRFFTGRPCKHGHIAERMVRSGACVECQSLAKKKRLATPEGKAVRNAGIAARKAANPTRSCVICLVPLTENGITCNGHCRTTYYGYNERGRRNLRAMAGIPAPGYSKKLRTPRRVLQQQIAEKKEAIVNQKVDIDALAVARLLTGEARRSSAIVNAEAHKARHRRSHAEYVLRRAAALETAQMMIPEALKGATYKEKVRLSFEFLKSIGASHPTPSENNHDTVR